MATRRSVPASKNRPCPVCGHDSWCRRYLEEGDDDRAVLCMRGAGLAAPGWKPVGSVGKSGGQVFRRVGPGGEVVGLAKPDPEARRREQEQEKAQRDLQVAGAKWIWRRAGEGTDYAGGDGLPGAEWAARYVEHRGIALEALPGRTLPRSVRGLAQCPSSKAWPAPHGEAGIAWRGAFRPALIAAVVDTQGQLHGLQRVFLERRQDGGVVKASDMPAAKLTIGSFSDRDGACRLGVDYAGGAAPGVLVLCEGVETGLALLAAGLGAVWAAISTSGLLHVGIPAELLAAKGGPVHTVVVAADFDRQDARRGRSRPGTHAAEQCCARIRWTYPGLRCAFVEPGAAHCPALIDDAGELREGVKTADWLDAFRAVGGAPVVAAVREAAARAASAKGAAHQPAPGPASGSATAKPGAELGSTDDEAARRFLSKVPLERARRFLLDRFVGGPGERWRLACWHGEWFVYRGGVYRKVKPDQLRAAVRQWLSGFCCRVVRGEPEPLAATAAIADDTIDAMKGDCGVFSDAAPVWCAPSFDAAGAPTWMTAAIGEDQQVEPDIQPDAVINTRQGLLDADAWCRRELRIIPHTTRWFSTQQPDYDVPVQDLQQVVDGEGEELCGKLCPNWLQFLGDVFEPDPGSIDVLQQWFGYTLTPSIEHEAILVMPGPPRSGKGTIFQVHSGVIGRRSVAAMSLTQLEGRFAGPGLFGRTAMHSHDTHIGRWADSVTIAETLKKLSSGDAMTLERKGKDVETDWVPRIKIMIATNETPKIPDASGALQARMVVVPTYKSFSGKEDRTLKATLLQELPGVFVWALFGLRKLREAGRFPITRSATDWLGDYRRLNAQVVGFVEDCCVEDAGSSVLTSLLRRYYLGWARRHGVGELSAEQFGANLRAAMPHVARKQIQLPDGARPYFYSGLRLRRTDDEQGKPVRSHRMDAADWVADFGFEPATD